MTIRTNKEGTKHVLDFKRQGYPRLRKTFSSYGSALIMEANLKALVAEGKPADYLTAFFEGNRSTKELEDNGINDNQWESLRHLGHTLYSDTKNWKDACSHVNEVIDLLKILTPLRVISERHIDSLVDLWKDRDLNPKTINRKLSTLSVLLKKAKRKHWIDAMPIIERLPEGEGRLVYYSDEMLDDFFATLAASSYSDMEPVYWFLLDTGCRTGELTKFTRNERHSVTFYNTKSGKPRTVPLTQRLKDYLDQQDPELPFPMLTNTRLRKSFEGVKSKLGWSKEYVRHTFRHTCATRLVRAGVHISAVKEWLGHSNINTTMIYIQVSEDHLKDAVKALEAL